MARKGGRSARAGVGKALPAQGLELALERGPVARFRRQGGPGGDVSTWRRSNAACRGSAAAAGASSAAAHWRRRSLRSASSATVSGEDRALDLLRLRGRDLGAADPLAQALLERLRQRQPLLGAWTPAAARLAEAA